MTEPTPAGPRPEASAGPAPAATTRIVLVDEQRLLREGVRCLLGRRPDLRVVGEAGDEVAALDCVRASRPDLVILDLVVPRPEGAHLLETLRRAGAGVRCLVLSARTGRIWIEHALEGGAAGFLPKTCGAAELLQAIDVVRAGGSYFSPAVAACVVEILRRSHDLPESRLARLTRREREVLRLLAEGLSTREIGARLGVSPKTANSHRSSLMSKVGIHKSSALVRFAIREGLVAP